MTQSATLGSLSTWRERNGLRPLAEVAREQGQVLRQITGGSTGTPARTPQRQAARERAQTFVAQHAQPKPQTPITYATPNLGELYAEANRMAAKLPAGRYALPRTTPTAAGNDITFFEVVEFRNGTRRLYQLISNGTGLSQQKLHARHQVFAASHILEDVAAAAGLFGRTLGICAFGPHPLTNARSRAAGYGETCAKHRGLPW